MEKILKYTQNETIEKKYICSFFGHWEINVDDKLIAKLTETIERLIVANGVNEFWFGGYGEFDNLCYKIVSKLKEKYPKILRAYVLDNSKYEHKQWKDKNISFDNKYDKVFYLPLKFNGWTKRIYFRNCEMIERSNYIIFYIRNTENSGASKALKYAMSRNKNIINV